MRGRTINYIINYAPSDVHIFVFNPPSSITQLVVTVLYNTFIIYDIMQNNICRFRQESEAVLVHHAFIHSFNQSINQLTISLSRARSLSRALSPARALASLS
jgi:hypothetical protein